MNRAAAIEALLKHENVVLEITLATGELAFLRGYSSRDPFDVIAGHAASLK
jgi:hypothetical protein